MNSKIEIFLNHFKNYYGEVEGKFFISKYLKKKSWSLNAAYENKLFWKYNRGRIMIK